MQKFLMFCVFWSLLSLSARGQADLNSIRDNFYECTINSAKSDSLLHYLEAIDMPTPLIMAYAGATQAIYTKTIWNPYKRLVNIKQALKKINGAVAADLNNLEVRFLRYAIEFHVPGWLMVKKHLEEDGDFLYEQLLTYDLSFLTTDILMYIAEFYEVNTIYPAKRTQLILDRLQLALIQKS